VQSGWQFFSSRVVLLVTGDHDVTVGKFYATFLIQDYFRRFKKRKEKEQSQKGGDHDQSASQVRPSSVHQTATRGWLGSLVVRALDSRLHGRDSRVRFQAVAASTGMGDRLGAGKPPKYFTKPSRPTQPPTLSGTGNEYQSKCGYTLRLRNRGRYDSFQVIVDKHGWQIKLCDP